MWVVFFFLDAILTETHRRLQHVIKEIIGRRVIGSCSNNNKNKFAVVVRYDAFISISLFCTHLSYSAVTLFIHILTLTLSVAGGPRNHELVASCCGKKTAAPVLKVSTYTYIPIIIIRRKLLSTDIILYFVTRFAYSFYGMVVTCGSIVPILYVYIYFIHYY